MWRVGVLLVLLSASLLAPGVARAGWFPVDGAVNGTGGHDNSSLTAITDAASVPYVTWQEPDEGFNYNHQAGFLSNVWTETGGFMRAGNGVALDRADIVNYNGAPTVAWSEQAPGANFEVYVSRLVSGTWTMLGTVAGNGDGPINVSATDDARTPDLVANGSTLCVTWSEHDTANDVDEVWVKCWNGTSWVLAEGGPLNTSPTVDARSPVIVYSGGYPYLAWLEFPTPDRGVVRTAWINEEGVIRRYGPLNRDPAGDAAPPRLAPDDAGGGGPHVAWVETAPTPNPNDPPGETESHVRVDRFEFFENVWKPTAPGSPVNDPQHDAGAVDIATNNDGKPLVVYTEQDEETATTLHVKRLSDGRRSWIEMKGTDPLDRGDETQQDPSIAVVNGQPHVAWAEDADGTGTGEFAQIWVSRFLPGAENTSPPAVSGLPATGNVLTCTPGSWTNEPDFTFLWERAPRSVTAQDDPAWAAIDGASGSTYTVQQDDEGSNVRCRVIATGDGHIGEAVTAHLRADRATPFPTRLPHVNGIPIALQTLTCDPGEWDPGGDFEYIWYREGVEIPGETSATHAVTFGNGGIFGFGDAGNFITCGVRATNDIGSDFRMADNRLRAVNGQPIPVGQAPRLSYDDSVLNPVGQEVRCNPGEWWDDYAAAGIDGYPYRYAWLRNGEEIAGETGSSYVVKVEDLGKGLHCRVWAQNIAGETPLPNVSLEYLVPLPTTGSQGRLLVAQGNNEFVPTNLMAIGREYELEVKRYASGRMGAARDAETARCRQLGFGPIGSVPTREDAETAVPMPEHMRCSILVLDARNVTAGEGGVTWRPGNVGGDIDLGFGIPPVDPERPLPVDPLVQQSLANVTPTQVIWDVDRDGRTDASCPGSAPVLRSLYRPGYWNPRAIVVYPHSGETGRYSIAELPGFKTPRAGDPPRNPRKRPGQPFACRTSIEQPPEPQVGPCISEATMGRVRITGNICPISVRSMDPVQISYIERDDPQLYALLHEMAEQLADRDPDSRATARVMAPPVAPDGLLPRGFGGATSGVGTTLENTASSYGGFGPDGLVKPGLAPPPIPAAVQRTLGANLDVQSGQFAMDQMYVTKGQVKINGIAVDPLTSTRTGLLVPSDAQEGLKTIDAMKIAIPNARKKLGDLVLEQGGRMNVELQDRVDQSKAELVRSSLGGLQDAARNLKFGPFKFLGDMDVKLENDGTATMTATASIPFLTSGPGGGALTTRAQLRGDLDGNISLEGFELRASDAYLGFARIKDLLFRYGDGIQVRGRIELPFPPKPAIDIINFELDREGVFRAMDIALEAGTGVPVGPGVFLTRIRAGYKNAPDERLFNGGAGVAIGPSAGGCPTVGIDADFFLRFREIVSFDATGEVSLVCLDLFNIDFHADSTGYVTVKGGWNLDEGPVYVNANLAGSIRLPSWQIEFGGTGGIRGVPGLDEIAVRAVLGDRGLAACASIKVLLVRIGGGAGIRFTDGRPPLTYTELLSNLRLFLGCDLSSWKSLPARTRAAQAGGGLSFDVDPSGRGAGLSFQGAGEAPRVRLRSPSGRVYDFSDTGPEGKTVENALGMIIEAEDRTVVLVEKPEAGRWTVETADGSPEVVRIEQSTILPVPKVTGRVGGIGSSRILRYDVRAIPGQVVRLVEQANGAQKPLRTVRGGGRGTVRFTTSEARGTRRSIVAQVIQDGMPRDNITIARFTAPSPKVGRPRKARIRRRGRRAVVTWRRAQLARSYDVIATVSDGRRILLSPRGKARKVTVPALPRTESVSVRVVGISPAGRRGPAARARLKAPKPRKARQRRRARRG